MLLIELQEFATLMADYSLDFQLYCFKVIEVQQKDLEVPK